MGARTPQSREPRERRITQVPSGNQRTHHGTPAHVKSDHGGRYRITHRSGATPQQITGQARRTETSALQCQKSNFLGRIESPETGIELQTIDDARSMRGVAEKDVLRTQIAVSIAQPAPSSEEQSPPLSKPRELSRHDRLHRIPRECEIGCTELTPARPDLAAQVRKVATVTHRQRRCTAKEQRETGRDPLEVTPTDRTVGDRLIEHARRLKPSHLHQPVDHLAGTGAQRQHTCTAAPERDDSTIHLGSEPPVEFEFRPTRPLAQCYGPIVHRSPVQRLFQFVRSLTGKEDPGEMGLDGCDHPRSMRIMMWFGQKGRLRLESALCCSVPRRDGFHNFQSGTPRGLS